jgi:DinB family protein
MESRTAEKLREAVDRAMVELRRISDTDAGRVPAPGKWSKKEIIGHLIDSAANNHARFVRAQTSSDLVFDGYDQDEWVRVQRYRERRWEDLVRLWQEYNRHIAFVMAATDEPALTRPRARHSLDTIAFKAVPSTQPVTLEYLMRDYIDHLEHHLRQVLREAQ